eukprot:10241621-Alexandrium_andersonii.AAC.1
MDGAGKLARRKRGHTEEAASVRPECCSACAGTLCMRYACTLPCARARLKPAPARLAGRRQNPESNSPVPKGVLRRAFSRRKRFGRKTANARAQGRGQRAAHPCPSAFCERAA